MKKALKIILAILWVLAVAAIVVINVAPEVVAFAEPYVVYVYGAAVILTALWIVIFGISGYNREVGDHDKSTIVDYKADEVKKSVDVTAVDTQDIYSNFERAEFAPKVKEPVETVVLAHPTGYPKPVVEEPVEEVKEEVVEEVKVEQPVETPVEEVIEVVEEKVEQPVEEKVEEIVEQPVEEVKEEVVEEVKEEPKVLIKLAEKEQKPFELWPGHTVAISEGWSDCLRIESGKKYFKELSAFVQGVYESGKQCYPASSDILKAFELTDMENVRVVILGKIPFYRKDQADGLAFSTSKLQKPNQTTTVIINEAIADVGIKPVTHGSLENWAKQGVFLLNSTLTAPSDKPASHSERGWVTFTETVLQKLIKDKKPKVFVLWGEHARSYVEKVQKNPAHLIIEAPNPSPLSAANGFYGSKPFSKINEFLVEKGYEPINWELE